MGCALSSIDKYKYNKKLLFSNYIDIDLKNIKITKIY